MAVEIKMKTATGKPNNIAFFKALLSPKEMEKYYELELLGVSFTLTFYGVTANLSNIDPALQSKGVTLCTSTTSIMKSGAASLSVMEMCRVQVLGLITEVQEFLSAAGKMPASDKTPNLAKALSGVLGAMQDALTDAPAMPAMPAMPAKPPKPTKFPKASSPTGVVALSAAHVLGQAVKGSNSGSVYYVVALSPTVKLAVRVKSKGGISFRVEGDPTPKEKDLMKAEGLKSSGTHWSMHLDTLGVPPARCLGAFLMSLPIEFHEKIQSYDEIKVEA